ncbi:hypothetical protein [Paraflavitalea speifideaquila]|uniref:hypothetical protein n=1 Tax=Paraflavitalea speifideaquila TaxID=3076558 RepID=UPI0028E5F87C|nr:hypothetical protein [Paraflavitalea speifideiaquila]
MTGIYVMRPFDRLFTQLVKPARGMMMEDPGPHHMKTAFTGRHLRVPSHKTGNQAGRLGDSILTLSVFSCSY